MGGRRWAALALASALLFFAGRPAARADVAVYVGGTAFVGKWSPSSSVLTVLGYADAPVAALALDAGAVTAAHALYVGGHFAHINGTAASYVACWNGTTWLPVGGGTNGAVLSLLVDAGASVLYAGGQFSVAGAAAAQSLAAWNGAFWTGLSPGATAPTASILAMVLWGGDLVVGGAFVSNATGAANLARWDGSAWSLMGNNYSSPASNPFAGSTDYIATLTVTADGTLLAGGSFAALGNIGQWNATSAAWQAVGAGVPGVAVGNLAQFNGSLYASTALAASNSANPPPPLWWWNETAAAWDVAPSTPATVNAISSLAVVPGLLVVGADFRQFGGATADVVYLLTLNQSASSLSASSGNIANASVAAWATFSQPYLTQLVTALHANCDNGFSGAACDVCPFGAGYYGPVCLPCAACVHGTCANGTCSACASPWTGPDCDAFAVGANVDVFVGGSFDQIGAAAVWGVAVWNATAGAWGPTGTGAAAQGLQSAPGTSGSVGLLGAMRGSLVAGGQFQLAGGLPATNVATWNGTGWQALAGVSIAGTVSASAVANGTVYLGGLFTATMAANGSTPVPGAVVAWNGVQVWVLGCASAGASPVAVVEALAIYGNELYVGGTGGSDCIAVYSNVTGTFASFNASAGPSIPSAGAVYALAVFQGRLYIGGSFDSAGGRTGVSNLAAWAAPNVWSAVGAGYAAGVASFAATSTALYVAGGREIAQWDGTAMTYLPPSDYAGATGAIYTFNDIVFAVNEPSKLPGQGARGQSVVYFTGQTWKQLGDALPVAGIASAIVVGCSLGFGGSSCDVCDPSFYLCNPDVCLPRYFGPACWSCGLCHGVCQDTTFGACSPPCTDGWTGAACEQAPADYAASSCALGDGSNSGAPTTGDSSSSAALFWAAYSTYIIIVVAVVGAAIILLVTLAAVRCARNRKANKAASRSQIELKATDTSLGMLY